MSTKTFVIGTRSVLAAAAMTCTLFGGNLVAKGHDVTIALHVSAQGLDLSQPADAQTFYTRLQRAARVVCTHGNRVDLVPADNPRTCYEKALGSAIRAAKAPMLTQIYLANHQLEVGTTAWIYVPVPMAAK